MNTPFQWPQFVKSKRVCSITYDARRGTNWDSQEVRIEKREYMPPYLQHLLKIYLETLGITYVITDTYVLTESYPTRLDRHLTAYEEHLHLETNQRKERKFEKAFYSPYATDHSLFIAMVKNRKCTCHEEQWPCETCLAKRCTEEEFTEQVDTDSEFDELVERIATATSRRLFS